MAKKYTITKEDAEEIKRCALDFSFFCEKYLCPSEIHGRREA